MGNFHCVSSSCATVVYREYLPPVVRWRYSGEEWQEIEGDDYEVEEFQPRECPGVPHIFKYQSADVDTFNCALRGWNAPFVRKNWSGHRDAPFTNFRLYAAGVLIATAETVADWGEVFGEHWSLIRTSTWQCGMPPYFAISRSYVLYCDTAIANDVLLISVAGRGMRFYDFGPDPDAPELEDCPTNCRFKVFKNGAVVHQETRNVCPEVEVLPCRLDDKFKQIKIDKIPYLSWVEVLDYAKDTIRVNYPPFVLPSIEAIPPECLNIYKFETWDIYPDTEDPNDPVLGDFIEQICSAPGCPPPEYEVVCDCEPCESCPDGTCAIECGGVICCYGSDGVAVKSIPIGSYCDG